ncbi:MAG TPA: hypothetical protein VJ576_14645 [Rhodocyclaceae bacterium]|nr:hypothetical protein [Rhodocyclaceae bacterium]
MRYLLYLLANLAMEAVSFPLAFVLPFFARNAWLPRWLWWFQTPDNSLEGDSGWQNEHWQWRKRLPKPLCTYVGYTGWLLRNRAYGFKWTAIAAPVVQADLRYKGDLGIKNRDHARAGLLRVSMDSYWQYKRVWQIPGRPRCVMLNFGWQLDNYVTNPDLHRTRPDALFMFSPRLTAFRPD